MITHCDTLTTDSRQLLSAKAENLFGCSPNDIHFIANYMPSPGNLAPDCSDFFSQVWRACPHLFLGSSLLTHSWPLTCAQGYELHRLLYSMTERAKSSQPQPTITLVMHARGMQLLRAVSQTYVRWLLEQLGEEYNMPLFATFAILLFFVAIIGFLAMLYASI